VPFWPSLVLGARVFDFPDVFVMATSYRKHGQLPPNRWRIWREQIAWAELEYGTLNFL
jgi:hypothetical protein